MNKLPPSVRKSLIEKASGSLGGSSTSASTVSGNSRKWCLQSLATINERLGAGAGINSCDGKNQNRPNSSVAEVLLTDVNMRLATQHKTCLDMIAQLELGKGEGSEEIKSKSKANSENKNKSGKIIIRAVNNPVQRDMRSFREWIERKQQVEEGKEQALKILKDLEILHADTFAVSKFTVQIQSILHSA